MVLYKNKKKVWIWKEKFSFQEVYDEVIEEYPSRKTDIQQVSKTYYNQHGSREGDVIYSQI